MFFVVKVVLVSDPTVTDIQESLGFCLVSVRIFSISFGDSTQGRGYSAGNQKRLPTKKPRGETRMALRQTAPVNPFRKHCRLLIFPGSGFLLGRSLVH